MSGGKEAFLVCLFICYASLSVGEEKKRTERDGIKQKHSVILSRLSIDLHHITQCSSTVYKV